MTAEQWISLKCHPSARTEAVRAIAALVRRSSSAELQISFRLDGDVSRIHVPARSEARINTELWRHTCFEAFIAIDGESGYHEINFAPSQEWCVYAFRGYRDGGPLADETMRPQIAVRCADNRLELDAAVRLDRLSAIHPRAALHVGISAVVETGDGYSYWAIRHPSEKADFHHADGFALRVEPLAPPGAIDP